MATCPCCNGEMKHGISCNTDPSSSEASCTNRSAGEMRGDSDAIEPPFHVSTPRPHLTVFTIMVVTSKSVRGAVVRRSVRVP